MCQLFDDAYVDCTEIDIGMSARRKLGNEYAWIIEI